MKSQSIVLYSIIPIKQEQSCNDEHDSNAITMFCFFFYMFCAGRIHCKPPIKTRPFSYCSPSSSTPIRRSVSCPRSITALNAQSPHVEQRPLSSKVSAQVSRPSSGNRTNSLNRNSSSHRVPHTGTCASMYPALVSD